MQLQAVARLLGLFIPPIANHAHGTEVQAEAHVRVAVNPQVDARGKHCFEIARVGSIQRVAGVALVDGTRSWRVMGDDDGRPTKWLGQLFAQPAPRQPVFDS